jgi:poly-gamma-glutamate synthesis protein (capsule biosynthesis protein)
VLLHQPVWRQAATDAAAAGRSGYDFQPMFADVVPHIAAASLAICHLETPVGPPAGPFSGYPRFSVPPQIVTALRHSGFDTCSTASNHTLDAGESGVYRTLDALDAAGLRHAGSHRSAAEQRVPTVFAVDGVGVAHLSYTFSFNGLRRPAGKAWIANLIDPEAILAEARRARSAGARIVVVSLHWGNEYDRRPSIAQTSLAHRLLAGSEIDLILGSHAHVVQPFERFNGKWVVYGMGNEIARQSDAYPSRHEGVMPRFTLTELASGRWVVTKVEAIATWIDVTPRIRIVDLATAIANPATPAARRDAYRAAHRRIAHYLQPVSLAGSR